MATHFVGQRGQYMGRSATVIAVAAVLSPLLGLLAPPAAAADRLLWLAEPQPAVMSAFSSRWLELRGSAPEWLSQTPAFGADMNITLTVRDEPAAMPTAGNAPELFLHLPRDQAGLTANRAGIYAEPSPAALLALWQQLLPDRRPAGILVGAGHQALWPQWQQAAQQLPLGVGFVRAGEQAQRVFALVRPGLGLLLYSAGTSAADPVALGVILRESLASGLPVLGTDPALLPAGALAVLHQEPAALGSQAAELAVALLNGKAGSIQEPQPLRRQINFQVARSLQLSALSQLEASPELSQNPGAATPAANAAKSNKPDSTDQNATGHDGHHQQTDKQP
ncbi:hypothetical protein HPT27_08510 [Permianibacter sp. IMCC34836]|uniref:hypothetical protein n=1 Tax=Permianibacter fluminis TaxID=2738515 RepID=UPI001555E94B|nr:hypothetical protein [Permianibacter fluminis]NQD37064.1 hypothetical protein [Permianibacter fluminis]